jgi:uncharacterized protein YkwD
MHGRARLWARSGPPGHARDRPERSACTACDTERITLGARAHGSGRGYPFRRAGRASSRNDRAARGAAEVEAELFELLDRERNLRGLPPLERSPEITEAARAHSAAMRDRGLVARTLPGVEPVEDRLTSQRVRVIGPHLVRAHEVGEAHAGLMNEPSVRHTLLSSDASQVGIGIAIEEGAEAPAIYATYILARPRPPVRLIEIRRHIARDAHRRHPLIEMTSLPATSRTADR